MFVVRERGESVSVTNMVDTLADRVRAERERRGWSQGELGRRCGVTQQAIRTVESGKTRQPGFLLELADAFGLSPYYLARGVESQGAITAESVYAVVERELALLVPSGYVDMTPRQIDLVALHISTMAKSVAAGETDIPKEKPKVSFLSRLLSQVPQEV